MSSAEARLPAAIAAAGASLVRDETLSFPMSHDGARAFWDAFSSSGPLRAFANAHGEALMEQIREEFMDRAPTGPWTHHPRARRLVARR